MRIDVTTITNLCYTSARYTGLPVPVKRKERIARLSAASGYKHLPVRLRFTDWKNLAIDFEHHYIPIELGRRLGMDPAKRERSKPAMQDPKQGRSVNGCDYNDESRALALDAKIIDGMLGGRLATLAG